MISIDDARAVVLKTLEEMRDTAGIDAVPVGHPVVIGSFWVQGYQSREYVDTGRFGSSLVGNGPLAIPVDGAEPVFLSSALPAAVQIAALEDAAPAGKSLDLGRRRGHDDEIASCRSIAGRTPALLHVVTRIRGRVDRPG